MIVGTIILSKEVSMEFFQFLNKDATDPKDEVALGLGDIEETGEDFLWAVNPVSYINMVLEMLGQDKIDLTNLGGK